MMEVCRYIRVPDVTVLLRVSPEPSVRNVIRREGGGIVGRLQGAERLFDEGNGSDSVELQPNEDQIHEDLMGCGGVTVRSVIVGAGKVGFELASTLTAEGHHVIVIDRDEDMLREVEENLDVLTVCGRVANTDTLDRSAVRDADLFIAVTETDEVNMVACLIASKLGVGSTVARIRNLDYQQLGEWKLSYRQLGIDHVINPEEAVAYEIVKFLKAPAATEVEYFADGKIQLLGYRVQAGSPIAGRTIAAAHISHGTVAAVIRNGGVLVPDGNTVVLPSDELLIIGKTGVPSDLGWMVGSSDTATTNVAILGGGSIGFRVAELLERHWRHGPAVKLIENDVELCAQRARELHHTRVVMGDSTRPHILQEENIEEVDSLVAVTGDEQTNLFAGFMAKHLGARRVIAELHRKEYVPLATSMGIDVAVIPRVTVASAILRLVHKANVVNLSLLKDANLEVLEIVLSSSARVCNKSLLQLDLPGEVVIGAIIRGEEVVVPRGDTVLRVSDHLMIIAHPAMMSTVEAKFR